MSKPKQLVTVEKIAAIADKLAALEKVARDGIASLETAGKPGVMMDGWPTLIRGCTYIADQLEKIVGGANMPHIDWDELELPKAASDTTAHLRAADEAKLKANREKKKGK